MTDVSLITVIAPYRQKAHPRSGGGRMSGSEFSIRGRFQVPVRALAEREAGLVATLRFEHGGAIGLREHGRQFYRPVLAPGTHAPLGLDAFAEACEGRASWRDDPFAVETSWRDTNKGPRPAWDEGKEREEHDWRLVGDNDMAKVAERLEARAMDIVCIGGVVHVACPQPRLLLKTLFDDKDKPVQNRLTWSLPGLDGDDDPVTGPSSLAALKDWEKKQVNPTRERQEFHKLPWRWFGLADLGLASAFSERISGLQGIPFSFREDAVALNDARPLAPHPGPAPLEAAKAALTRVGLDLSKLGRPQIEAWLDARDHVRAGEIPAALARLAGAFGMGDPTQTPSPDLKWQVTRTPYEAFEGGPLLLRYVMVEGRAAPTPEESEADVLSLAGLARAR